MTNLRAFGGALLILAPAIILLVSFIVAANLFGWTTQ